MDVDVSEREIRAQPLAPSQAPGPLNPRTVAVLPLVNQRFDLESDYLCEGITDGIIFTLSLIPGLNVIGRTSLFHFKGQDARSFGARMRAGTAVVGTVRKSGSQLKIFTELIDVATGEVRWAETYERPVNDVFDVVAEIAEAVVQGVLHTKLTLRSLISDAPNIVAFFLFLHGWHALSRWTVEGFRTAAEIFRSATFLYPSYAMAYGGLAAAYAGLTLSGLARAHEVAPKALHAVPRAVGGKPIRYICIAMP